MDLDNESNCERAISQCGTCDEQVPNSSPVSMPKSPLRSLKAQPKDKCGYPCEFVDPPPTLLQSECSICLQILWQPHLISCCGHNFCKTCIDQVMKNSKPCPLCNEETFTVLHNKGLQRSLNELKVYCSNSKLGCEWKGSLGQYEQHMNEDPELEFQLLGCPYVEVECKHGCGGRMRRGLIAEHQNDQCPQRPFCCAYCREYDSIHADVVYRHWPICKKYPMTCPNHCTVYAIERQNMEEHLVQDCPRQRVPCGFNLAGCDVELPREELSDHLESNQVEHMSMLAATNQRLIEDLAEKDEQIAKLSEDVNTKLAQVRAENEQEIQSLRSENSLLKEEVAELKYNVASLMATVKATLDQFKNDQSQQERISKDMNERIHQRIVNLESKLDETKKDLSQQCFSIQSYVGLFPVEFVMSNFEYLRQSGNDWQSEPFYTHLEGYRLCLVVNPNGVSNTEDSYVSVYACLMQGEFDERLKWPFRGVITIQLLNQLGERIPATGTIRFTENTPLRYTSRVLNSEKAEKGWGLLKFIKYDELHYNSVKNRQFLKDDCLRFRVTKIDLNNS